MIWMLLYQLRTKVALSVYYRKLEALQLYSQQGLFICKLEGVLLRPLPWILILVGGDW